MKKIFPCPGCGQQLGATERLCGRVINCPKCGVKLTIPTFSDDSIVEYDDPGAVPPPSDESTLTETAGFSPLDENSFALPGADASDPMLTNFPLFAPNPFAGSFPLDDKSLRADGSDSEEEEEEFVNSKMPSLDELIN